MPTLAMRELVYCTDEKALYIGTAAGNVKLTPSPMEAQPALDTGASTAEIVTAINNLIAALKESGAMNNS